MEGKMYFDRSFESNLALQDLMYAARTIHAPKRFLSQRENSVKLITGPALQSPKLKEPSLPQRDSTAFTKGSDPKGNADILEILIKVLKLQIKCHSRRPLALNHELE